MREAEVRAALEEKLRTAQHTGPTTQVIHEMSLCQSAARIDLAAINGRLIGWEIKTGADSLVRLPQQQEVYSRVFDRVWLAGHERHIDDALQLIPDWWGVVRIDERLPLPLFREVRRSRLNPQVDLASLVRLLWRDEVFEELSTLGLAGDLRRAPRRVLWEALVGAVPAHLSASALKQRVREQLRSRQGWRPARQRTSDGG